MSGSKDVPEIVILPPVLVGGALVLGIALHYTVWDVALMPVIIARPLGLTLFVAALGVYLGVTLWVDGLAPLLLLFPVAWMLHWGIVLREEQYLHAKFGATYEAYRSQVRRWL